MNHLVAVMDDDDDDELACAAYCDDDDFLGGPPMKWMAPVAVVDSGDVVGDRVLMLEG